MEMNRETLYNGLNLMYIGELAAIIGLFVGLLILFLPGAVGLSLLILLAALVGAIVGVVGLARLRGEHGDYMTALILLVVGVICNLISKNATGALSVIMDFAGSVLALVRVYLVVRATNTFLAMAGRTDLEAEGRRAFYALVASTVVAVVIGALTQVLSDSLGGLIVLLVIISMVTIAGEAFYLIYLKHSAQALR